jgi:cathepsin B
MKFVIAFALVFVVALTVSASEMVDFVNKANKNWVAGENKYSSWTHEQLKCLMGADLTGRGGVVPPSSSHMVESAQNDLPASFDARQKWGSCIHPIRNQEQCGSCWAFSATEVLSDRFCLQSSSKEDVILSPQDLVSCDSSDMGCNGGQLDTAWTFMENNGVHTDSCIPYVSGNGTTTACPASCQDGSSFSTKYHAASYQQVSSVNSIMQEIYTNGPVQAAFMVYQDFMSYTSGVYKHTTGSYLGGHAIKVIGWGNENGEDYWLVANSWGTDWGLSGLFKILKGTDECSIEDYVYAGPAKI